jgi:Flavin containing amine oxidoreductase
VTNANVIIVGGGPAGVGLAAALKDRSVEDVVVLEADARLGGRSRTLAVGGGLVEMGTCYLTTGHRVAAARMKRLGIPLERLGETFVEDDRTGEPISLKNYVKNGAGSSLSEQSVRFLWERRALVSRVRNKADKRALQEASVSCHDWLQIRGFGKLENLFHRAITSLGYCRLDEVTIWQVMQWINSDLFLTAAINDLRLPTTGWDDYWQRLGATVNARTQSKVVSIETTSKGHIVTTAGDERYEAPLVVCAIGLDEWKKAKTLTDDEAWLEAAIQWQSYGTALFVCQNWFDGGRVLGFPDGMRVGSPDGAVVSARKEVDMPEFGGTAYVTAQLPGSLTESETKETLTYFLESRGARNIHIIELVNWKYFPRYAPEAICDGLIERMRTIQGANGVYYAGATFSHEAVSSVDQLNETLSREIKHVLSAMR